MRAQTFLLRTGQSLLVWVSANILGCIILLVFLFFEQIRESYNYDTASVEGLGLLFVIAWIFVIGLLLSAPVNLLLIPGIYLLTRIPTRTGRVLYSIFSILLLCGGVVLLVYYLFELHNEIEILLFMIPYIPAALISFFLVTLKLILHGEKTNTITGN